MGLTAVHSNGHQPEKRGKTRCNALLATLLLATVLLACGWGGSDTAKSVVRTGGTRLPTLTPTQLPTLTSTPGSSGDSPTSTALVNPMAAEVVGSQTESPVTKPQGTPSVSKAPVAVSPAPASTLAYNNPGPTPPAGADINIESESDGWSFINSKIYHSTTDELLLIGKIVNNTGAAQKLGLITGTFFDEQGQVVAGEIDIYDIWPVDLVPPGGTIPFALEISSPAHAAGARLRVEAEVIEVSLRQEFEFLDVTHWTEFGEYCVGGRLRNPGTPLEDDLVLALVLYDGQDWVVNFDSDSVAAPETIAGDQTWPFEICVEQTGRVAVRHELQAWGL